MDISLIGVVGALVMYGVSVSPSLLARSWQWHAVASGVLSAVGYIVGLTIQRFYALVVPRLGVEITAPRSVSIAFRAVLLLGFFLWFLRWLLQSVPIIWSECVVRPCGNTSWELSAPSS